GSLQSARLDVGGLHRQRGVDDHHDGRPFPWHQGLAEWLGERDRQRHQAEQRHRECGVAAPLRLLAEYGLQHRGVRVAHPAPVLARQREDVERDQQRHQQQQQQQGGMLEPDGSEAAEQVLEESHQRLTPWGGACRMLATLRYDNTNRAMSATQSRSVRNWMWPTPERRREIRIRSRWACTAASIRSRVATSEVVTQRSKSVSGSRIRMSPTLGKDRKSVV